jgi:hypothetical protein
VDDDEWTFRQACGGRVDEGRRGCDGDTDDDGLVGDDLRLLNIGLLVEEWVPLEVEHSVLRIVLGIGELKLGDGDAVGEWLGGSSRSSMYVSKTGPPSRSLELGLVLSNSTSSKTSSVLRSSVLKTGASSRSTQNGSRSKMVHPLLMYTSTRCLPVTPRPSITAAMCDSIFLKASRRIEYFGLMALNQLWGRTKRNLG